MAENGDDDDDIVTVSLDVSADGDGHTVTGVRGSANVGAGVQDIDSDIEEVAQEKDGIIVEFGDELKLENPGLATDDAERLQPEKQPYPVLHAAQEVELTGRKLKVVEKIEQEAMAALTGNDPAKAVERYTEAMRMGGSTALLLSMRALVLLKMRRPFAAVRDCTAALQINSMILKAYRIRGIAHRKLGNWRKAHRDLTQAQSLNFDEETASVQKFVAKKLKPHQKAGSRKDDNAIEIIDGPPKTRAAPALRSAPPPAFPVVPVSLPGYLMMGGERFVASPSPPDLEFDQGQAVIACCLKGAARLNGKRGVVVRRDPHPSRKGRWEVELRHDDGRTETVALKAENIMTLNKLDKDLCKAWIREEKRHKELVKVREAEAEVKLQEAKEAEAAKARQERVQQEHGDANGVQKEATAAAEVPPESPMDPVAQVQKKLASLPGIQSSICTLFAQLEPEQALEILDKATKGSGIANLNAYLKTQASLLLGDDSDDEDADEDRDDGDIEDKDLIPEESAPFPPLTMSTANGDDISDAQLELAASAKRQALEATERSDLDTAIDKYTEAMTAGGATALLLAKRADLLLKQKRPCAAVRDCTVAIEVNPDSCKAHRVRGLARRALGQWEDALKDLERAQTLEHDESIVKVQNYVALQVNKLQERGPNKRGRAGGGPPGKRAKAN